MARGSVPKHYTLALNGNIQKITAAVDIGGNALNGGSVNNNIWAENVTLQVSNDAAAVTDICFIAYKEGTAPTTVDKTTAMIDLLPGQIFELERSKKAELRGEELNLRYLYAKGVNGDYLHIILPEMSEVTT